MKRYVTVVPLLLLISTATALGQARLDLNRAPLKGLKKFHVLIESFDAESQSAGLSTEQLRTDVELRLRRSRVPVQDSGYDAYLYVNVNPLRLSVGNAWAYAIHVGFRDSVTLDRDKSIGCLAETWDTGGIFVVPTGKLVANVREHIGDYVDKFINDYLAANP
jgi:hypothetical protein